MTDPLAVIADLRAFAETTHAPGSAEARIAACLRPWLDGDAAAGITLEAALGLKPGRGRCPWWRIERQKRRSAAARNLLASCGDGQAALTALRRYATGRGRFAVADAQYQDPQIQAAHDYLMASEQVPESSKTLRRVADRK